MSFERIRQLTAVEAAIICAKTLDEKKSEDILLIDLKEVNSYLDLFLIATGSSQVHCRGLYRELSKKMHELNFRERNKPDLDSSWIIMDYDELVIHIFTREKREYYRLEHLWADAERINYMPQVSSG